MKHHTQHGISIMELFVVIAIISIFVSITIIFFETARSRSRDARRMHDIHEIQTALHLYQTNNGGVFPVSPHVALDGSDVISTTLTNTNLIAAIPTDPLYPIAAYYYSATTSNEYALYFCLETDRYDHLGFAQGCTNSVIQ